MNTPRVRVRRDGPHPDAPWRAMLADELVGYFPTQPEAVLAGFTAARFLAAGIPWRPIGGPQFEAAS